MPKNTKKIIVNILSLSRVIGALFLPLIFAKTSVPALIILIAFLFITDFLDGFLARTWKAQTIGGSLLDPMGDKFLAIFCIISLISVSKKLVFLLLFECLIGILNVYRTLKGEIVKSSYIGKTKTWVLSITLVLGAINLFNPNMINLFLEIFSINCNIFVINKNMVDVMFYITIIFEFLTFVTYLIKSLKYKNLKVISCKFGDIKAFLCRIFDEEKYNEDKDKSIIELINNVR